MGLYWSPPELAVVTDTFNTGDTIRISSSAFEWGAILTRLGMVALTGH